MAAIRSEDFVDPLLEDIRDAPDDDGARLVWADAIGGERGELVVIQLDLARGGLTARETIARKQRQRVLLARSGAAWSGLDGIARRVSFARGFVDAAELDAPAFLAHAGELVEAAPLLSSITVTNLRADQLAALVAAPVIRALRGLELACDDAAGDLALELLARTGLPQLRALGSRDPIGMRGGHALSRSLQHVERLWLSEVQDADAMHALLTAGPALRSLALGPQCPLAQLAHLIPRTVTELLAHDRRDGLAVLARTPIAATLERLDLGGTCDARQLAAFPRLRSLAVSTLRDVPRAHDVPALRELAIDTPLRDDLTRALADELGPQLELLDLRNSAPALRHVNALKTKVAGELLVGNVAITRRTRSGLLRIGHHPHRPWWDHVTLE